MGSFVALLLLGSLKACWIVDTEGTEINQAAVRLKHLQREASTDLHAKKNQKIQQCAARVGAWLEANG